MTLYLKDLFEIPESIHQGDFVLELARSVNDPEGTMAPYVVTDQLAAAFDNALTFIQSALNEKTSKATYLHGSFGCGKSHFMAVLHLLLRAEPHARKRPELAKVVSKHGWVEDRNLLLIPFHMIGKSSLENAIFGTYTEHVHRLRPDAPPPHLYLADTILENAVDLRETMGDEIFFAALNKARPAAESGGGLFGDISGGWDAASFQRALAAAPDAGVRHDLVGDLTKTHLRTYRQLAANKQDAFVSLDDGLAAMSRHARELGFDGVILFLDELILWLSGHAGDTSFINREVPKVSKLVEAQNMDRPVPIISFVARQRDLRELVGDHIPGAERLGFADNLKFWDGRFHKIVLEDANLPIIVEKRILKPKSEESGKQLDAAFRDLDKADKAVWDLLLTEDGDRESFRKLYPFSPVLIQALTALAPMLQRQRTSLRILYQLLVRYRSRLRLGELVPVGDLFEALAEDSQPLSVEIKRDFDKARKLYRQKLQPMLLERHKLSAREAEQPDPEQPAHKAYLTDDRLIKTLLLSALVPHIACFRQLTAKKLAALNHGQVKTLFPGQESDIVLKKLRAWSKVAPDIRISGDPNPLIALKITGIDTETILERVQQADAYGARIRMVRRILYQSLGIEDDQVVETSYTHLWRNSDREVEVIFQNVREMSDEKLTRNGERWSLFIDYPFDRGNHKPKEDRDRLADYRDNHSDSKVVCWLPGFLSQQVQTDLGTLVRLEHIFGSDDRFRQATDHLSQKDRHEARHALDNQRSRLREEVNEALLAAYGMDLGRKELLDPGAMLDQTFESLHRGFDPRNPVGARLKDGFENLLDQIFDFQYPDHPYFGTRVTKALWRRLLPIVMTAAEKPLDRHFVEKKDRKAVEQALVPLELVNQGETHITINQYWRLHFDKQHAREPGEITVAKLKRWLDRPNRRGLPRPARNLVILVWAKANNRHFIERIDGEASVYQPDLDRMPDDLIVEEHRLPDEKTWARAVERVYELFGGSLPPRPSLTGLEKLAEIAAPFVTEQREPCRRYRDLLDRTFPRLGLSAADSPRRRTARAAAALLDKLAARNPKEYVEVVAAAEVPSTVLALGENIKQAAAMVAVLERANWDILIGAFSLDDERAADARRLRGKVEEALSADELTIRLEKALRAANAEATRLLTASRPASTVEPVAESVPVAVKPEPGRDRTRVHRDLSIDRARAVLDRLDREAGDTRVTLSYLEKGGDK